MGDVVWCRVTTPTTHYFDRIQDLQNLTLFCCYFVLSWRFIAFKMAHLRNCKPFSLLLPDAIQIFMPERKCYFKKKKNFSLHSIYPRLL